MQSKYWQPVLSVKRKRKTWTWKYLCFLPYYLNSNLRAAMCSPPAFSSILFMSPSNRPAMPACYCMENSTAQGKL